MEEGQQGEQGQSWSLRELKCGGSETLLTLSVVLVPTWDTTTWTCSRLCPQR